MFINLGNEASSYFIVSLRIGSC